MNRSKRKLQSKYEEEDCFTKDSGDDIPDDVHNRFLEDIKQFYGKPKITSATRNEPAVEVSEFNLRSKKKSDKGRPSFRKDDLLRPLRSKQPKLAQKLEAVKKTSALPKPLETVFEKKIQREVGFEKAKKQLDRWSDVVQGNRVADQLHFPLKNRKIEVYDHTDDNLFSSFSNPTPLEKELAAVLNSSDVAKEDKEKMEQSKFRTTLKDILAKRKMMASVRARASYAVSKARRQNKIKSKKYHRLIRSERTKQQIKDFEELQKTDPEAALNQLEMLDKSRAEERATLRHRNTGKWARNQIIKAKYNKESRIALSEQLCKNRELTQKLKVRDSDDDSADESDVVVDSELIDVNSNNPWIPGTDDYGQFISNYKKYWEGTAQEIGRPACSSTERTKDFKPAMEKKKTEEAVFENNEKNGIAENSFANSVVEKKKISQNYKKENKKSVATVKLEENDVIDISEKRILVEEIMSSSGCWTVTELRAEQNDPKMVKSKESKENSVKSGIGNNVCEMFKSLEDKISRKLKRKFNEVEKFNNETIVENEKTDKKKKKRKKKKQSKADDTQQLLDQSLSTDNNGNNKKNLTSVKPSSESSTYADIDANKFSNGLTKQLATEIPDTITVGGENIDDDEDIDGTNYREMVEEAFETDDVVANFVNEKAQIVEDSKPKLVDSSLRGWGSWTSSKSMTENNALKARRPRINKRLLFKVPKVPPRKDANKGHVIMNEEKTNKMKEHMVSDLPYPFTQVKDFETTIRAPIGRSWIPETAHKQLVAPPVVTKLGTVIEPMDEGELIERGDM